MDNRQTQSNARSHIIAIVMALIVGILGTLYALNHPRTETPALNVGDGLTVHYIDVGQGDSILLTCEGETMLIDGGNNTAGDTVVRYLKANGVKSLDVLVSTHPHKDHCGGLDTVVQNIPVKVIYSPVAESDNAAFQDFAAALDVMHKAITVPQADDSFAFGSATVTVLGPRGDYLSLENTNDQSLVLRVEYGETVFLFMGDAEYAEETAIIDAGCELDADILKVGHHGSDTSTGYRLLYEVSPDAAVISCGANNEYGHPHDDTMSRLRDADITVYRTDEQGTILCITDGETITFLTEK